MKTVHSSKTSARNIDRIEPSDISGFMDGNATRRVKIAVFHALAVWMILLGCKHHQPARRVQAAKPIAPAGTNPNTPTISPQPQANLPPPTSGAESSALPPTSLHGDGRQAKDSPTTNQQPAIESRMVSHAHPTLQPMSGELAIKPAAIRDTRPSSEQSPHGELVAHRQPHATPPATETKSASTEASTKPSSNQVTDILKHAFAPVQATNCYSVFVTKQERLQGRLSNSERTLLTFRREPFSVALVWQDGRNDGRQCVFVAGQNNNRIVSKGGKADFLMSGRVMMIDPDGSLARMRGHYSIRETGIENMLNRLAKTVAQESQGDVAFGTTKVEGIVRHPDLKGTSVLVVNRIPPRVDSALPNGAVREWYFDANTLQLVLVQTFDANHESLEQYYLYENFTPIKELPDSVFAISK